MEQTECRVTCPRTGERDVQMTLGAMIEHIVVCGPGHMVVLVEPCEPPKVWWDAVKTEHGRSR